MLILLCGLFLALIFAKGADKYDNKILLFCTIVILSILAGCRDITVGTDTKHYYDYLSYNLNNNGTVFIDEPGFYYSSKYIMEYFGDVQSVFIAFSFIINALILFRLWAFRSYGSFCLMVFFYVTLFYPQSLNIMRQYIALSIIFAGTIFLEKEKIVCFFSTVLLAIIFHKSSILSFILVMIYYICKKRLAIILFLTFMILATVMCLGEEYFIKYLYLFRSLKFDLSVIWIINFVIVIIHMLTSTLRKDYKKNFDVELFISVVFYFSLVVLFFGSFFNQLTRIGLYFSVFLIPFYGFLCSKSKNKKIYQFICCFIAIYCFVVKVLIFGETGIIPYKMFFF